METKLEQLLNYSNPKIVLKKAKLIFGPNVKLAVSTRENKKYQIYNPNINKWVHFGSFNPPMEDYTYHKDEERRMNYILRASNIKGNWKDDSYSPNNLSIHLLW